MERIALNVEPLMIKKRRETGDLMLEDDQCQDQAGLWGNERGFSHRHAFSFGSSGGDFAIKTLLSGLFEFPRARHRQPHA